MMSLQHITVSTLEFCLQKFVMHSLGWLFCCLQKIWSSLFAVLCPRLSNLSIFNWFGERVQLLQTASSWLNVVPWGIYRTLNYLREQYNNPVVYITENGMPPPEFWVCLEAFWFKVLKVLDSCFPRQRVYKSGQTIPLYKLISIDL